MEIKLCFQIFRRSEEGAYSEIKTDVQMSINYTTLVDTKYGTPCVVVLQGNSAADSCIKYKRGKRL